MSSMKTRILTAVIAIPLIILLIFFMTKSFWIATILLALATALITTEYLSAGKLNNNIFISIPAVLFSFSLTLLAHTQYILIPIFAYFIFAFFLLIIKNQEINFKDFSYAFTGTIIISFGMACFSYLCTFYNDYTIFFFVLVLGTPWLADAGAYFSGTFLGKHKLCPNISPKKTIEGFIGGVVFCIATAIIIGVIFENFIYDTVSINYTALIIIGILDSVISVIGDLSFSLVKRYNNIKDYGSIFPGHGGMLDRCDSVIFTAPLILCVHQLIPVIM